MLLAQLPQPDEMAAAIDFAALSAPEAEQLSGVLLALPAGQRRTPFWSDVGAELLRGRSATPTPARWGPGAAAWVGHRA